LSVSPMLLRFLYHGVLAHQHDTLTAHGLANLVHLLGRDIVDTNDEDAAVLLEQVLKFVKVLTLVSGFAPHIVDAVQVTVVLRR